MTVTTGRVRHSVLAAAVLAWLPVPAVAQPAAKPLDPGVVALHRVAECLVRRDARRTAAFLATAPDISQSGVLAGMQASLGDCAADVGGEGAQLRLSAGALRGPIAEALFERDFTGWTARSGRRPIAVYALTPPPAQAPRARLLADMAACVADARPGEVLALLATEPASAGEGRTTAALIPVFGPCLRAGQTADVGTAALRGLLAEAAYRRAVGLAGPQSPSR